MRAAIAAAGLAAHGDELFAVVVGSADARVVAIDAAGARGGAVRLGRRFILICAGAGSGSRISRRIPRSVSRSCAGRRVGTTIVARERVNLRGLMRSARADLDDAGVRTADFPLQGHGLLRADVLRLL